MVPTLPFWFRQRQCKIEAAGENVFKATGPNLGDAFLSIRPIRNGHWQPVLRLQSDGPDVDAPAIELDNEPDAWEAAFELYRRRMVV